MGQFMTKHIGVKVVLAAPMTLGEYNTLQGWGMPADQDPSEPGYLVEYTDGGKKNHPDFAGYISWCPKEQFENANRPIDALTFGHAIEAAKMGKKIARAGWNGKGMFVYLVPGSKVDQSELRGSARDAYDFKYRKDEAIPSEQRICSHMDMMAADGSIVVGWLASQTDMLAEDWMIVE